MATSTLVRSPRARVRGGGVDDEDSKPVDGRSKADLIRLVENSRREVGHRYGHNRDSVPAVDALGGRTRLPEEGQPGQVPIKSCYPPRLTGDVGTVL